jgi:predicted DNA-binding protein (UPF0251 family)
MSNTPTPISLTLEEKESIRILRKSMQRKPEIAALLMKDMSREVAVRVMLTARDELNQLLAVNRAFTAAAAKLAQQYKETNDGQATTTPPAEPQ